MTLEWLLIIGRFDCHIDPIGIKSHFSELHNPSLPKNSIFDGLMLPKIKFSTSDMIITFSNTGRWAHILREKLRSTRSLRLDKDLNNNA